MVWIGYLLTALGAYLLGSIPSGYWVGLARGVDIRRAGSGNIGATNAFRILGKTAGVCVLGLDALKGFAACQWLAPWLCNLVVDSHPQAPKTAEYFSIVAGLGAVLGHIYTCWLQFKGGKGIATTAGVFGALAPSAMFLTLGMWILVCALTRYVSLASISAAITLPIMVWVRHGSPLLISLTAGIGVLAIYKHKTNLRRLLSGTEHRIGSDKLHSTLKSTP